MRALEDSSFPKTKVLKFKMLLRSMQRKRTRIQSIFRRLDKIEDEDRFAITVQGLTRDGLISKEEQDKLLKKDAVLELKSIANIIKEGENPEEEEEEEEEEGEEEAEGGNLAMKKVERLMNPYLYHLQHPYEQWGFSEGEGLQ